MRGTAFSAAHKGRRFRITPACAGNSGWRIQKGDVVEDHPRVCGEQVLLPSSRSPPEGSPPRVRGTVICFVNIFCKNRITPACAGNRTARWICGANTKDHPRVCGEQIFPNPIGFRTTGSPPRVRGTVAGPDGRPRRAGSPPRVRGTAASFTVKLRGLGITPACAGNSVHFAPVVPYR